MNSLLIFASLVRYSLHFYRCDNSVITTITHGNFHRLHYHHFHGESRSPVWETRPSAETPSDVHWRRFYFQLTCVHSALELSGRCALQIYLLTYFHHVQSFILNFKLGSSANPFLHRLFPLLSDSWFHGLPDHLMFLFCSTATFVCMVC